MLKKFLVFFSLLIIFSSTTDAKSIITPEGNFPRVQWAVVESTLGNLENLMEFQNLMSEEYFRAVKDDSEVFGMFLIAEQANPNIFHVMNIFKDESAYKNYIGSKFYKNLR